MLFFPNAAQQFEFTGAAAFKAYRPWLAPPQSSSFAPVRFWWKRGLWNILSVYYFNCRQWAEVII